MPEIETASAETLTRKHFHRVYNFCRTLLSNPADVEDACQEVFLTVMRRSRDLGEIRDPVTWLMKIARLTCLYVRRKRGRAVPIGPEDEVESVFDESPEVGPPIRRDELGRVWAAVERLPQRYRAVLGLHFQQELSHEKMAEVLDLSRGAVRVLLHRAVARLRQEVRRT